MDRVDTAGGDIVISHNKREVPFIFVPHLHTHYEIYYNISGAKGYMVNGNFFKCGERDLIVIPKVQAHKVLVKQNGEYERCLINIDDSTLQMVEMLCGDAGALDWLRAMGGTPAIVNLSVAQHGYYVGLIDRYIECSGGGDTLLAFSAFLEILHFLKEALKGGKKTEYMSKDRLSYADQAMKFIELHFRTATVAEIADAVNVNKDYLNRVFKEETGMTLSGYLILRKLTEAKKYLYLGKSAKEACILSGFHNYANFTRTFKKHEGCSPKEFGELI